MCSCVSSLTNESWYDEVFVLTRLFEGSTAKKETSVWCGREGLFSAIACYYRNSTREVRASTLVAHMTRETVISN